MSTISSSDSALHNMLAYNQRNAPVTPTTTVAQAQQTVAQTPATILSSFVPANTSLYGAAPAVDSLLGNIGTSAGLSALAQINGTRSASKQISPFGSAQDAVSYATQSIAASNGALVQSALGSVQNSSTSAILAAYYPHTEIDSGSEPQINVTA